MMSFTGHWRMVSWNLQQHKKTFLKISRESIGNLSRTKKKVIGGLLAGLSLVKTQQQRKMTGDSRGVSGMVTFPSHPRSSDYHSQHIIPVIYHPQHDPDGCMKSEKVQCVVISLVWFNLVQMFRNLGTTLNFK